MTTINYYERLIQDNLLSVYYRRKNIINQQNYFVLYVRNYFDPKYGTYNRLPSSFKLFFDTLEDAQYYRIAFVHLHFCDMQDTKILLPEYDSQLNQPFL